MFGFTNCRLTMHLCRVAGIVLAALLSVHGPSCCYAVEAWADSKLPAQEGLELWLDGALAAGEKQAEPNRGLSQWLDASGKGRNLKQKEKSAQPTYMKIGSIGFARFDGLDDFLRATQFDQKLDSFTIVLVAAARQNMGGFPAFMALNAKNERDYTSGINIDLGPNPSLQFTDLNVEGRGFGGVRNLLKRPSPFSRLHIFVLSSDTKDKNIRLLMDGEPEDERPRAGEPISFDEITLGARHYNNGPGPQQVAGFGKVDVAELLVYNRALSADELANLNKYLSEKYDFFKDVLPRDPTAAAQLETVKDAPPVQMFVPGFSVRQLPLDLTNINNLKYRADGTLVAQAYDGKIYLLRDTDGDGLEDKADVFWDNPNNLRSPIGMDLTPPGYEHGNGAFVAGHSRFVLIVDTDGDDKADKEIELVGGWNEIVQSVDGIGVAYDPRDGSIYYGRGTRDFTAPLLIDKEGKAQYRTGDESGTINRVSADFKTHEIFATGIRFPVAIRINARGDLFCTDQEGATWVPNGNPFDELLHIKKGRHYGFPARHPVHLPNVIDEPSTFDYTPQHQSTCGLNFNEPVKEGGPVFGPPSWRGNALVVGESRGKLYRTELSLSNIGYIARNHLIGSLTLLTIDACVGPAGELVISCHSGAPDWGTGPSGKGKLYKVSYNDAAHPQPALVWAAGPREVRLEFDRPVPTEMLRAVLSKATLTGGKYARAGDRFETIWPGYAVVQMQKLSPRFDVPIRSAQLTPDGRTLVLATDSVQLGVNYALTLPDESHGKSDAKDVLPQHAAVDLDFDLTGCEATWQPAAPNAVSWTGWLPHVDTEVSREFTAGSAPHAALWESLKEAGELTIRGQLDLNDMLRPAVQPGSKIDYKWPPESVTVTFVTKSPHGILELGDDAKTVTGKFGPSVSFTVAADAPKLVPFKLRLTKKAGPALLSIEWTTNEDTRRRPLPIRRLLLPWADVSDKMSDATLAVVPPPELKGGDWARGYREFFGEKAQCSKCHAVGGRGGKIGPDLSNLVHRDYASVVRDIAHPSFAINPDFVSYIVTLSSGQVLTGVVHSAGDAITVGDAKGVTTKLTKADIEEMKPSPVSAMPEKLPDELGSERMRDLLTFLLTPPPAMPRDYPGERPKPRTVAEVEAILAGAPNPPEKTRPIRVLLVAGAKDHGIGEHDYPAWLKAWPNLLSAAEGVRVDTAFEWPQPEQIKQADVMVFFQHGDWNDKRAAEIDPFLARGGGLVYLHWALDGGQNGKEFAKRIGLAKDKAIAFRHGPLDLVFNRDNPNPIIRNFDRVKLVDESYWKLTGPLPPGDVLASSVEDGAPQPQIWTNEPSKGRVLVSIPGHYSWTFDDPFYRILVLRGIAWVAREPVDRFNEVIWLGADR